MNRTCEQTRTDMSFSPLGRSRHPHCDGSSEQYGPPEVVFMPASGRTHMYSPLGEDLRETQ